MATRIGESNIYPDLRDKYLVNMNIGIFKGEGPKRELLAIVPLPEYRSPRPIGGNCQLKANRNAVARAYIIAAALMKNES